MSQSLMYHAFGVREGYEYRKTEYVEGRVEFHLSIKEEMLRCPDCGHGVGRLGNQLNRDVIGNVVIPFGDPVTLFVDDLRCIGKRLLARDRLDRAIGDRSVDPVKKCFALVDCRHASARVSTAPCVDIGSVA